MFDFFCLDSTVIIFVENSFSHLWPSLQNYKNNNTKRTGFRHKIKYLHETE